VTTGVRNVACSCTKTVTPVCIKLLTLFTVQRSATY